MSDYPMLISNKLHSFRNFREQNYLYFMSYTVLSIVLGLTAVYVGHLIIKAL